VEERWRGSFSGLREFLKADLRCDHSCLWSAIRLTFLDTTPGCLQVLIRIHVGNICNRVSKQTLECRLLVLASMAFKRKAQPQGRQHVPHITGGFIKRLLLLFVCIRSLIDRA
jgi:hypothetical protein